MLQIIVPSVEMWDEVEEKFVYTKEPVCVNFKQALFLFNL